jgi:hypothetical protein
MLPCDLLTPSHIPAAGNRSGHPPNLVHLEATVQHVFSEKREHVITFHASVTVDDISTYRFSTSQALSRSLVFALGIYRDIMMPRSLHVYKALAAVSLLLRSSFLRAWRSELPPMCCLLMKMLGTLRWLVISARAFWMSAPSSAQTTC